MRNRVRRAGALGRAGVMTLLAATMVAMLLGQVVVQSAAAQDDLTFQTRVVVLHADPSLGQVEVHINDEEVLDEFEYGMQSDWIDIQPGGARVTITYDRVGMNYIAFDAVYPAPAGNDYYLIITEALVLGGSFDTTPIPDGGARVRIVQGSVSLPAVNVTASGGDVELATDLTYPRTSEYVVVPAGAHDIDLTLADTGESVLTVPGMALEGNATYELVIMGQPGDENHPLELRALAVTTGEPSATPPAATPAA